MYLSLSAPSSSVGAGDTFIAGMLYGMVCRGDSWDPRRMLAFGVELATLKVQREGFGSLGADIMLRYPDPATSLD